MTIDLNRWLIYVSQKIGDVFVAGWRSVNRWLLNRRVARGDKGALRERIDAARAANAR